MGSGHIQELLLTDQKENQKEKQRESQIPKEILKSKGSLETESWFQTIQKTFYMFSDTRNSSKYPRAEDKESK